jgi:hypothetical protein
MIHRPARPLSTATCGDHGIDLIEAPLRAGSGTTSRPSGGDRIGLLSGNRLTPSSGLASGSLTPGPRRPSAERSNYRRPVGRSQWPQNGESRYPPAPLRSRRLLKASQKTTEIDDHHYHHLDPGTHRPDSPGGTR